MIKRLKSYLSLERIGYAFTDIVEGKGVYYYRDCYGRVYMKNSKWALFSVAVENGGRIRG